MWRNYYTTTSLEETLSLLAQHGDHARIVAGGTDIMLELERGARPEIDTLIDITRVPDLDQIQHGNDTIQLGALVTHNHVVASDMILQYGLPLAQASWEVGAPQIRNRATVAGNIITASPANDTITALMALQASVTLRSSTSERIIPLSEFYVGYRQTVLQPHEMLTSIQFPALQANQGGIFLKLALRRAQAISVIDVAAVLTFAEANNRQSTITDAVLTIGCVAPTIIRLTEAEEYLTGKSLSSDVLQEVGAIAAEIPTPIDDVRGSATYRNDMIKVYLVRMLRALRDGTEAQQYPQHPAMLWGKNQAKVHMPLPQMVRHERDSGEMITTTINGQQHTINGGTHKNLLRFLRDDIGLTGTKEGCAEGECGACTIFLDGAAVMACMVPAPRAHGADIVTIEGLQSEDGKLHPIQKGFVDAGAVQCGFCTPGFLMSGAKLLEETPTPTPEQVEQSISGNLCRCTGYYKIIEAFERAQKEQTR